MAGRNHRVDESVPDIVMDLLLPPTDRAVAVQWAVMTPFWIVVLITTRGWNKDVRTFLMGLAMLNLAWFAVRTLH